MPNRERENPSRGFRRAVIINFLYVLSAIAGVGSIVLSCKAQEIQKEGQVVSVDKAFGTAMWRTDPRSYNATVEHSMLTFQATAGLGGSIFLVWAARKIGRARY